MKPVHLFTSILAVATVVVTSCSAPKYAQQNTVTDDLYGTTAQAREYTPRPASQETQQQPNTNDEYYGTNDPYYDMTYSSRINRFYYGSPWRNYYDPYFDYYGMNAYPWYGSRGWGNFYSPFYDPWGYNGFGFGWGAGWGGGWGLGYYSPWGFNNYGWNSYYGGGFLGGGYYGGGFYTGRTTIVPNYTPRPSRGSSSGYRPTRDINTGMVGSAAGRSDRGQAYTPGSNRTSTVGTPRPSSGSGSSNNTMSRPTRGGSSSSEQSRPAPTRESYTPPSRPERSYSPPPSSSGSSGSSSSGSSSGGGGGGRPTRGSR